MSKKAKIVTSITTSALLIAAIVFFYVNYNKLDITNVSKLENKLSESLYADSLNVQLDPNIEPQSTTEGKIYTYKVVANETEDFTKLPDEEKVDAVISIARRIDYFLQDDQYIKIGNNKFATIESIDLKSTNGDIYSVEYQPHKELNDFVLNASTNENGTLETKTVSSEIKYGEKTNPNVEITSDNASIDGKYIYVKGTVKNTSTSPLSFIELKVSYYNDEGVSLDTETTYVNSSDELLVGEQKSFEVMTEMINEKYTKYSVEIVGFKN